MARSYQVQNAFNGGQLGKNILHRFDDPKYTSAAKRLENMTIQIQGPVERRTGSRYVSDARDAMEPIRLIPFVFNADQVFVLEFGNRYVRFYKDQAQVLLAGVPLEVETPYTIAEVPDLDFAQSADTMFITHPTHPPSELVRFADDDWRYQSILLTPTPTQEFGFAPNDILTLSATTGEGITATTISPEFLETDVDRLIAEEEGNGAGIVVSINSPTQAVIDVVTDFSGTVFNADEWRLTGSPRADLSPDKSAPVGAKIVLSALREQVDETELVTNGDFSDPNLANWTNYSPRVFGSGTDNSGLSGKADLVDTTQNFVGLGVIPNHTVINVTDGSEGTIATISTTTNTNDTITPTNLTGGTNNDFDNGDVYRVEDTSTATSLSGSAVLNGGIAGISWIEQPILTVVGDVYRLTFDVADAPLSVQVGSASQTSDVFSEASFDIGNENEAVFTATSAITFLQFRNNQNTAAQLDNVSVKLFSADTFRTEDVGMIVKLNGGIVEITSITLTTATGIIRKRLNDTLDVTAGSWTLESPVWTAALGYPSKVTLFEQRLILGGSTNFPLDVWGSVTGNFFSFASGTNDGDSFRFTLTSQEVNQFQWMIASNEILIGTQREEFVLEGGGGRALTPTNVIVRTPTPYGSVPIQPLRVGNATLFVQRDARVLRELVFSDSVEDLEAADLTIFAEDLTKSGIRSITYQQFPQPTIWVVLENGTLLSAAYLRRQRVIGWAVHPTQGLVRDVTVIPVSGEDQVWIAVERFGQVRVEYLDTQGGFYDKLTLDSSLSYTGVPTSTLTGLDHLTTRTVRVLGDGANLGTYVVSNFGVVTGLPVPVERADVGLDYTSVVETLRPIVFGGNGGASPTIGMPAKQARILLQLFESVEGFKVQGDRVAFRTPPDPMTQVAPLFTGEYQYGGGTTLNTEGTILIEQDLPLPLTIQAIAKWSEIGEV